MPQPWPTAGDYAEALQNPHLCFTDPQLQGGVVDKKLMGTPCGSDGNSAIVFELRCASETYAIKCFKRPAPDRQQHYNELSQRLSVLSSPLLMKEFVFLQDAISIRGEWFPILKMERVNPNQLGFHVDKCLSQGTSLLPLAESFRNMMRDIETLSIVHGDLQHGNVLIEKNGTLKLIDYDGTCVLPWQGATPQERGHPNYQHPERATLKPVYYDANLDAFSAQVIYLSLIALEADPSLWAEFYGQENLLFLQKDYASPGQTPIWNRLANSPDSEVSRLTAKLDETCRNPISAVAALESLLLPPIPPRPFWQNPNSPYTTVQTAAPSPTSAASPTVNSNPSSNTTQTSTLPLYTAQTSSIGVVPTQIALPQEKWSDNLSRNLRWALIVIVLVAVLIGIIVAISFKTLLQTEQSAPVATQTNSNSQQAAH